jgi:hypothetical protein
VDRLLLILPSATYRAPDFLTAARDLGVAVTVASERRAAMSAVMGERALTLRRSDPAYAAEQIAQVILRHALGLGLDDVVVRESMASGVMMIPIPGAGVLRAVEGQQDARAVDGIAGLEITIARGRSVVPLPEGDRYLGFLFARGTSADAVESSLRVAHACLRVRIEPHAAAERASAR